MRLTTKVGRARDGQGQGLGAGRAKSRHHAKQRTEVTAEVLHGGKKQLMCDCHLPGPLHQSGSHAGFWNPNIHVAEAEYSSWSLAIFWAI